MSAGNLADVVVDVVRKYMGLALNTTPPTQPFSPTTFFFLAVFGKWVGPLLPIAAMLLVTAMLGGCTKPGCEIKWVGQQGLHPAWCSGTWTEALSYQSRPDDRWTMDG